jgi:hypothetical protein
MKDSKNRDLQLDSLTRVLVLNAIRIFQRIRVC